MSQKRPVAAALGGANPQEVKDLKIKLSHKDKEIRELKSKLGNQQVFLDEKTRQIKEVEIERDSMMIKIDAMAKKLKESNIEFEDPNAGKTIGKPNNALSNTLLEQYKGKLQKS
jgi:hypothetical protein